MLYEQLDEKKPVRRTLREDAATNYYHSPAPGIKLSDVLNKGGEARALGMFYGYTSLNLKARGYKYLLYKYYLLIREH
jgi:hypothetical protein